MTGTDWFRHWSPISKTAIAIGVLAVSASMANAAPDVAAGKTLFMGKCAVCHKADASGGVKLGAAESADLRSPDLEDQYHETDALLERAILTGMDEDGGKLDKVMPRWKGKLTKDQVDNVIAYLKTVMK